MHSSSLTWVDALSGTFWRKRFQREGDLFTGRIMLLNSLEEQQGPSLSPGGWETRDGARRAEQTEA